LEQPLTATSYVPLLFGTFRGDGDSVGEHWPKETVLCNTKVSTILIRIILDLREVFIRVNIKVRYKNDYQTEDSIF
jgi:hypothetical protein